MRVWNIIGFDPFYTRMFRKGDARLRSLALRASPLRGLFINTLTSILSLRQGEEEKTGGYFSGPI